MVKSGRRALTAVFISVSCVSCTMQSPQADAETMLNDSIGKLMTYRSFAYDGLMESSTGNSGVRKQSRFEGYVRNPEEVYIKTGSTDPSASVQPGKPGDHWMRITETDIRAEAQSDWNPKSKLEQLKLIKKTVGRETTGDGTDRLIVRTDPADAKRLVVEDWHERLTRMTEAERQRAGQEAVGRPPEQQQGWIREIDNAAEYMKDQLEERSASMTVNMTYRFEIDRQTGLPKSMTEERQLLYMDNAKQGEDKQLYTYSFKDIGKNILLPTQ